MKAVAVALVLIAGAAVVLWYGNMSNSWVVGGLIGGLAALLLSIPISLSLFSYLSRRHDERIRAEEAFAAEERSLVDDDPRFSARSGRRSQQYIESSIYDPQEDFTEDERYERYLDSRIPLQRRLSPERRSSSTQQDSALARDLPRLPAPASKARTRELNGSPKESEWSLPRRKHYPGLPASDAVVSRGKQQSEALRTARLEATRDADENASWPTQNAKRHSSERAVPQSRTGNELKTARRTRQLSDQVASPGEGRQESRQRANGRSPEDLSEREEERLSRLQRRKQIETDALDRRYASTERIVPPVALPPPVTRHPHLEQESLKTEEDGDKGHGTRPLIRRAPYLYDDDPLRQELFQHIETPPVRRSSRNESASYGDEEDA